MSASGGWSRAALARGWSRAALARGWRRGASVVGSLALDAALDSLELGKRGVAWLSHSSSARTVAVAALALVLLGGAAWALGQKRAGSVAARAEDRRVEDPTRALGVALHDPGVARRAPAAEDPRGPVVVVLEVELAPSPELASVDLLLTVRSGRRSVAAGANAIRLTARPLARATEASSGVRFRRSAR